MSARRPRGLHRPAATLPATGFRPRRIPRPPLTSGYGLVTVDLADDGIALPATFGAGGTATVQVGPNVWGVTWSLDQIYASTSVGELDPSIVTFYVGAGAVPTLAVSGSLAGGSAQIGAGGQGVQFGEFVWAVWTGGTPGASAFLRVTGNKTAPA